MTAVFFICLAMNWNGACVLISCSEIDISSTPDHCLLIVDSGMRHRVLRCSIEGRPAPSPIPEPEEGEPV